VTLGRDAAGLQLRLTGAVVEHEVLDEAARLDVGQYALHFLLGFFGDDARAGLDVAIFGGVADRIAHVGDAAFIHQVDDQLQFVQTFEIGHFGCVTGFHQRFEAGLDQRGRAAAQHGLLAEQVGFAFLAEVGFDDAAAAAANAAGVGQGDVMGVAGRVLIDGDQAGDAAAALIFAAHGVARTLGRDHDDVHILARLDQAEMDVQAMGKGQRRAGAQIGVDVVGVDGGLMLVGGQDHEDIGPGGGFGVRQHLEPCAFGLLGRRRTGAQRDGDFRNAAVAQVLRMGMTLRTIAQNGDLLALDQADVRVVIVINLHECLFPRTVPFSSPLQGRGYEILARRSRA